MKTIAKYLISGILSIALAFTVIIPGFAAQGLNVSYGAVNGNTRITVSSVTQDEGCVSAALKVNVNGGKISSVSCPTPHETEGLGTSSVTVFFEDLNEGEKTGTVSVLVSGVQNREYNAVFSRFTPDGEPGATASASGSIIFNKDTPIEVPSRQNNSTGNVGGDKILSGTPNVVTETQTKQPVTKAPSNTLSDEEPATESAAGVTESTVPAPTETAAPDMEISTKEDLTSKHAETEGIQIPKNIFEKAADAFADFTPMMWVGLVFGVLLGIALIVLVISGIVYAVKKKKRAQKAKARREEIRKEVEQKKAAAQAKNEDENKPEQE